MATVTSSDLAKLYEVDETAWLEVMAGLLRVGRLDLLDSVNLAEFLESMANRDRREVTSRLRILLAHLLKWSHQPERRSASWTDTIVEQREELEELFESATLQRHAEEIFEKAYAKAVRQASRETRLPPTTFPAECPYTLENAMTSPLETDPA